MRVLVDTCVWSIAFKNTDKRNKETCEILESLIDENRVDIIMFSSNWTDPNDHASDEEATRDTINYWYNRMMPVIKADKYPVYMVLSDRIGEERETHYKEVSSQEEKALKKSYQELYLLSRLGDKLHPR